MNKIKICKLFSFLLITSILFAFPSDKNKVPDETNRKISITNESRAIKGEEEKALIGTKALASSDKKRELDETNYKNLIPNESRVIIGKGAKIIVGTMLSAKLWYDNIILLSDAKLIKDGEGERDLAKKTNADNSVEESTDNEASLPTELSISKAYPNPFNPVVNISYGLPERADVKIVIHDLIGRRIAAYSINQQSAGWHEFNWRALDQYGQKVGSGIYLLTIQASDMVKKQKITYLK